MSTTLIGVTAGTYTHGIASQGGTGINVESITCSVEPEFREDILDATGHVQGQAVGCSMTTLTVNGETIRTTNALQGLLVEDFVTESAVVYTAADTPMDGDVASFIAQSAEITKSRGSLETTSVTYISRANLSIV